MKQIIISLLMALLPMVAMADAVEINGIYYNLVSKTKTAEVTSNPNKYQGAVNIPSSVIYNNMEYSVTSIGNSAFRDCSGLTSITIPNSVTSIGDNAFFMCGGLTTVHITDLEAWCRIIFSNYASNPLNCAHHLYMNGSEITNFVIPNSVTSIGNYAFYDCTGLTSVTIPNSVISLGNYAFHNCTGLTSVTIPNSVTSIGDGAFRQCSSLFSVTIPNSVISLGDYAFHYCRGLTSITIGNSVTSIGRSAFYNCTGLTSITIPNSVTSIGDEAFRECSSLFSVTIGNSVTSIGYGVFLECTGLTSVAIGNSVTYIGNAAFWRCTGLTSLTIPNSVTSIDYEAFRYCSALTSVSIGGGVKTIGSCVFSSCPELKDVYCHAESVPSTNANAFEGSYIDYATLHVPSSSVNAYRQAEPWKNFKSIVALDGTTPETQKCAKPSITYQNGQLKMTCATEGAQFVTDITDTDIKKHYDAIISLTATYNINVYATKTGFEDSDVSSIILCWIDQAPSISTGTVQVPALPVLIKSEGGWLTIEGADDGTQVTVYTIDGMQAGSAVSHNGTAIVGTNLRTGSVAIVKIGNKSVKVVL